MGILIVKTALLIIGLYQGLVTISRIRHSKDATGIGITFCIVFGIFYFLNNIK